MEKTNKVPNKKIRTIILGIVLLVYVGTTIYVAITKENNKLAGNDFNDIYVDKDYDEDYNDDYEDVIHRTGRYYKTGRWTFLDSGIEIKKENLPRKFHKLTYEDEPIEI